MMELHLQQKNAQILAITQEMRLALNILQMDVIELQDYIAEQALQNPVVDLEDTGPDSPEDIRRKKIEWLESFKESDYQNSVYYDTDKNENIIEKTVANDDSLTLEQHLSEQIPYGTSECIIEVLKKLFLLLNDDGYLVLSDNEYGKLLKLYGENLAKAVEILKAMDPKGMGAENLSECLSLQLPGEDSIARLIVKEHLDDIANNKILAIAKKINVSVEEVSAANQRIKKLNPRPGAGFGSSKSLPYINPDIIVIKFGDHLEIKLNDFSYPKFNINHSYVEMIKQSNDEKTNKYIDKKIQQAMWTTKCIASRGETLLKVAHGVVTAQEDFFRNGPKNMRILHMYDIAQQLDMHPSTISRAVKNKYIQCSYGIFPLKHFFVQGTQNSENKEEHSTYNIKKAIEDLIKEEDSKKPYSDQQIAEILSQNGIGISRRTVAKYREQQGIPKSGLRKEF